MPLKIRFSSRANEEIVSLLDYIQQEFGTSSARELNEKISKIIDLIGIMPLMFPSSHKKDVRRCVVTKYTTLYYKVGKTYIDIVSILDNRKESNI